MTIETITAIATPSGRGGVGIVRVSGAQVRAIAEAITGALPKPRYAHFAKFSDTDGDTIDEGLALFFPGPNSFTGEDVLELQGHGGPVVMDRLLKRVLQLGARVARPGEFSERAFLNDKLDLAQAEAIADLIDAQSEQAARSAMHSLQGEFSARINTLLKSMISLRMFVEAAIDFPEEEIDFLSDGKVTAQLTDILQNLESVLASAKQGAILREGMTIVIAGKPNAGKSSLLNQLSGRDSAIVTDIAGTTRDVLREHIQIDGIPLHVIDTAGLHDSDDIVEQEGIKRAWQEIEKADAIVLVHDVTQPDVQLDEALLKLNKPILTVQNKIDLQKQSPKLNDNEIHLSAKSGDGIELLKQALKNIVGYQEQNEGNFIARRRHLDALQRAQQHVLDGQHQLQTSNAGELLAEDLLQAQNALSEITGTFTPDDLLGEIFSSFCVGK
tara:strand:+ start:13436 stop:14761 length:1326 start_codon:yes stop_codon:yes gene_type:complete